MKRDDSVLTDMLLASGYTAQQIEEMHAAEEDGASYQCTWSQTNGYQDGVVYVNNGENCSTCGTPLTVNDRCPHCEVSNERIATEKELRILPD
jgi:hypothetical protein